jgi:lipopolysaccharide export system permease protein
MLLDRYLARRLVVPFLLGVMIFLVILLGDEARKLGATVTGLRVPVGLILRYLLYASPNALVWSLPVGVLLGVAMTATASARTGETTAIRVAGASFPRICVGYLAVGLVASLLAFEINEVVVPRSARVQRTVFAQMTMTQAIVHEAYDQFFRDDQGRIFYVQHMDADNNSLEGVQIWTLGPDGHVTEIDAARRALLRASVWTLEQGSTVYLDAQGAPLRTVPFASKPVTLTRALQDYYANQREPLEMTVSELRELSTTLEQTGQNSRRLRVHLAFKYSIPLACLVLAMIAAPLADRFAALGSFGGLVVAICLLFLYNGVRSWGLALGLAGVLPPGAAGWVGNFLFGALGLWLLARRR